MFEFQCSFLFIAHTHYRRVLSCCMLHCKCPLSLVASVGTVWLNNAQIQTQIFIQLRQKSFTSRKLSTNLICKFLSMTARKYYKKKTQKKAKCTTDRQAHIKLCDGKIQQTFKTKVCLFQAQLLSCSRIVISHLSFLSYRNNNALYD